MPLHPGWYHVEPTWGAIPYEYRSVMELPPWYGGSYLLASHVTLVFKTSKLRWSLGHRSMKQVWIAMLGNSLWWSYWWTIWWPRVRWSCTWSNSTTVDDKLACPLQLDHTQPLHQQPLGGKDSLVDNVSGRWRFRLEAYGASNVLQKSWLTSLTISTDVWKLMKLLQKGKPIPKTRCPRILRVLVKELQSLGLTCVSLTKMTKKWNFVTWMRNGRRCHP